MLVVKGAQLCRKAFDDLRYKVWMSAVLPMRADVMGRPSTDTEVRHRFRRKRSGMGFAQTPLKNDAMQRFADRLSAGGLPAGLFGCVMHCACA